MLLKIKRDERGVAMIVALLVTFVVFLLSFYVVNLAIHDVDQSSYDRRRLLSVNAAEAGVNDYYAYLGSFLRGSTQSELTTIQCSLSASVSTGPNLASYTATIEFFNSSGGVVSCPPPSGAVPAAVRIRSTGHAPTGLPRVMESYAQVVPVYGGNKAALLSGATTSLSQKMTVNGYDGSDADAYFLGNLTVSNNETFSGNLYVQGSVTLDNSTTIDGTLWALNNISMTKGSSTVSGNAYSTNGSITISNPAVIYGEAKAKTTIASTSQIRGTSYPNTSGIATPPTQPFPSLPYDLTKWTNAGFQLADGQAFTTCAAAKSWLTNPANLPSNPVAGVNYDYVLRLQPSPGCDLSFGTGDIVNLPGNVAILTDCGITMSNHPVFQSVNGNHSLYLISVSGTCPAGGSKAISTANQVEFNNLTSPDRLDVFIYSEGAVTLANLSAMNGQVYGKPVTASNQTTLNYVPVYVPGLTTVTGFRQNVQYIREVQSS